MWTKLETAALFCNYDRKHFFLPLEPVHSVSPYCLRQHLANNVKWVERGDEEKEPSKPPWGTERNKSRPSAN